MAYHPIRNEATNRVQMVQAIILVLTIFIEGAYLTFK